jgi:hypothetical protein
MTPIFDMTLDATYPAAVEVNLRLTSVAVIKVDLRLAAIAVVEVNLASRARALEVHLRLATRPDAGRALEMPH